MHFQLSRLVFAVTILKGVNDLIYITFTIKRSGFVFVNDCVSITHVHHIIESLGLPDLIGGNLDFYLFHLFAFSQTSTKHRNIFLYPGIVLIGVGIRVVWGVCKVNSLSEMPGL
jgi:hypothetical protein